MLDLTVSNPTVCGFRYPEAEILGALANRRALDYTPESKGLHSARESVAAYYRGRTGFSGASPALDPERIVLTSGTSEGYSHILRLLCQAEDEVLVPAPSYPLFEFLADLADIRLPLSAPLRSRLADRLRCAARRADAAFPRHRSGAPQQSLQFFRETARSRATRRDLRGA